MLTADVGAPWMTRRIDAGLVMLELRLAGHRDERAAHYFDTLLAAFHATDDAPAQAVAVDVVSIGRERCDVLAPDSAVSRAPVATPVGANAWYAEWPFYRGVFLPDRATLTVSGLRGGLEHATRAALAFSSLPARGLAFHAATLRFGDHAVLVCGASGAGKSTISREGGADGVLTDEYSLLQPRDDGWYALPSPIWGFGGVAHRDRAARLVAIAVLTPRRDATRWTRVSGATALTALSPHLGFQSPAQIGRPDALQRLTELVTALPVYELDWLRGTRVADEAPWKHSM